MNTEVALVLTGIALIAWVLIRTRRYRQAKRWMRVKGVVEDAQVEKYREPAVYVFIEYLRPHVRYEYEVNGTKYRGSRVTFEKRNEIVPVGGEDIYWAKWKPGEKVEVYVNPEDPAEAVLMPQLRPSCKSHYRSLVAAGILLIGLGGMVHAYVV